MIINHRVLCCGGRNFSNYDFVTSKLNIAREALGDFAVIQGGAKGADSLCALWGKAKGLPVITVDANWAFYDKSAGPVRNCWMLDLCFPTYGIAFAGGNGTADMIRKMKERAIQVWEPK